MFFRFVCGLTLVLLVSLAGIALEKRNLELNRIVSRQHYQLEILLREHAHQRMLAQQLGAPARLIERVERQPARPDPSAQPESAAP